jgi:hypothetical protein
MTTKTLDSGSQVVDGEQPNSQVTTESVKPGSSSGSQPQEIEERLKRIEKMVSSFQSGKDRGITRVQDENAELRKNLADLQTLMKKGLSEDEAFEQLGSRKADEEFKQAVFELRDAIKGSKSVPAQAGGAFDPTEVILDLNLDPNDPVVKAAFDGKQFTLEQAEATAARLVREKKKQPIPNSAQMPSSPVQPRATQDETAALMERFEKAKMFPTSPEYKEVKKKLDERGWK